MNRLVKFFSGRVFAQVLTLVVVGMASRNCFFIMHQPEVPENLRKFSRYN